MQRVVRQGHVIWLVTLVFTLGYLISATAEPSDACRGLAKQFAETPEKLSEDHLFRLQTCIHRELTNRGIDRPSTPLPTMPHFPRVPGLTPAPGS
jgi:hypothetical protein